ncbi:MAG: hypothetical protein K0S61_79 [Anaerocolumna sp.]|jgi:hypothetical protein|nr:hypothetical protein [Anaerocolumna sp.]
MSIILMREAVKNVYPGDKWRNKVRNMSDNQVIAIYHKFLESKKLK